MFLVVPGNADYPKIDLGVMMYGENNSTAFPCFGNLATTLSASGGAKISTILAKWGTGSGYFNGNGYAVSGSYVPNLGATWAVEFWIFPTDLIGNRGIFRIGANGYGFGGYFNNDTLNVITTKDSGANLGFETTTGNSVVTTNQWIHIAIVKDAADTGVTIYVNGTAVPVTHTWISNTVYLGSDIITLGTNLSYPGYYYMNDFIIWNKSRYSGNFTPPSAPMLMRMPDLRVKMAQEPSHLTVRQRGL